MSSKKSLLVTLHTSQTKRYKFSHCPTVRSRLSRKRKFK